MIRWLLLLALALLPGCRERSHLLGQAFAERGLVSVAEARQTNADAAIVLRGTITEKCPVSGCWFTLQDSAGKIKVDTKNATFVVVDVPLRTIVTVAGRKAANGNETFIEATGVRY